MSLTIDIRDSRLRGGRMLISARTSKNTERKKREIACRTLIDRGELELIERLRKKQIRIEDVQRAVAAGDLDPLRRQLDEPLTLDAVLKRSVARVEATLETNTQRAYHTLDRMLREWLEADFDIRLLTREQAEAWLFASKSTNGNEPWSASRQLTIVTLAARVWNDAIEHEREAADVLGIRPRITRNPWKAIETKAVRKRRAAYLQPEEWARLREKVEGTPSALAFALGVLAGLRRGEICHMRMGTDFDRAKRVIHIQPRQGEYRWRPKTDRSIRTLDVSDELLELYDEHVQLGFAGERYLIHPERFDRPMSGHALRNRAIDAFGEAKLKYGIEGEGLTIHSLRHTFASWLVQDGTSPMVVADLIGDTVQMVIDVYGHLAPRNYREAIQSVGRISRKGFQVKLDL